MKTEQQEEDDRPFDEEEQAMVKAGLSSESFFGKAMVDTEDDVVA